MNFILGISTSLGLLVFVFNVPEFRLFLFLNLDNWDFPGHFKFGFLKVIELGFSSLYKHNIVLLWRLIILKMNKISLEILLMINALSPSCPLLLVADFYVTYPLFIYFS